MSPGRSAPLRVGVLVSGKGRGTNLQAIIDASEAGSIDAEVVVVVSTTQPTGALDRAQKHNIPAVFVDPSRYPTPEALDDALARAMHDHQVELVCLAGYMRRLTPTFLQQFPNRVMNIHPALLPAFGGQGMYGHHVHEAVYESGARFSGATVHFVDEKYDHGPIIVQRIVPIEDDDTPDTIAAKVLKEEHKAYPEAIQLFATGRLRVQGRRVVRVPPDEVTEAATPGGP